MPRSMRFKATTGAFVPTVALEGRALAGENSDGIYGRRDELSGKVVATWDIFRGGQDLWRRSEMAERYTEQACGSLGCSATRLN